MAGQPPTIVFRAGRGHRPRHAVPRSCGGIDCRGTCKTTPEADRVVLGGSYGAW